ncbi:MAG TPA: DPP IV N-terminal domain-containing protein, partial [Nannocystaceae bacterium]|nr:DPP IV N-terminal domain-containing protein [Nannocystaceae bacterium]
MLRRRGIAMWIGGWVLGGSVAGCSGDAPVSPTADRESAQVEGSNSMTEPGGPARAIPIEAVARYPLPGTGKVPSLVRPDPTSTMLTYLWSREGSLTRQLYAHDPERGDRKQMFTLPGEGATEENLSQEEKLRRERTRERGLGVTSYGWAREANIVMIPVRGEVWVQEGAYGTPRKVVSGTDHPAIDPQITRDGQWIGFVRDGELYVVSTKSGEPQQVTTGARGTGKTNGLAEYIAQEEMSRQHGFWWSHDASQLAFEEVDETQIPVWRIVHQGADTPSFEDHRYPFAGAANAKVRLGVIARDGGEPAWMDVAMDGEDEVYLARVHWTPTGRLLAEIENRLQTRLQLVEFDRVTGARKVLVDEASDVWINLDDSFHALKAGEHAGRFVWSSERTGFRHLYLYEGDGTLVRALTEGEWLVDDLVDVDEVRGLAYFTASKDGPTERHVYRVPLGGGAIERLTQEPGMHSAVLDRSYGMFVDSWSTTSTPPQIAIRPLAAAGDAALARPIDIEVDPKIAELGLTPPELVTLQSRDGVTLHGAVYRPPPEAGPGPWPVIVSVYGGPHAQRVTNSWEQTVDMRAQYLRGLGYLVFKLDNRGSARRGLAFEAPLKYDMGDIEVQDQVDGVRWLVEQGLADPERVGIYGWSYGGYMAAMALARAPETFKAAVAGAPVTSWDGYDTHY